MTSPTTSIPRHRTLSIGGATYDLFVRTGPGILDEDRVHRTLALPLGGKIKVQQVIETCGGGAANTSVGLARLGAIAHFCGILGSDQWGHRLLENFRAERVDPCAATIVDGETSSFSIILSAGSGERVILYDPGTNAHLHDANFDREHAATMNWIYLNHLHEQSAVIENDIAEILEQNPRIGLTWNPGGTQLTTGIGDATIARLLARTSLLVCNEEEVLQFTGETTVDVAIRALHARGVRIVCVCDGKNGATASDGMTRWHCPILADALVVDTTGAGDAFGTGMTWALLHQLDLPMALKAGTMNATSVIGAMGAERGLLTDIEMRQRLRTVPLDVATITP